MEGTLFSDRSLWTMFHGIALSGAALVGLAIALFSMTAMRPANPSGLDARQPRLLGALLTFTAVALWLAVIVGTYVVFPLYRAAPPAGTVALDAYPRALLLANPGTAWLHAFAMESKEHMPWIAAMLATAAAFVAVRYRAAVLSDAPLRRMMIALVGVAFVLTSFVGLLGILVNKVAPLE